jgi:hypothetical protein
MDALGPLHAPHVQECHREIGVLPSGNHMVECFAIVTFGLDPANATETAVIILADIAQLIPLTGIMPLVVAYDSTTGQIDVTNPAALDVGLSGVAGCVHTIDANKPTEVLINEANIEAGSDDERALDGFEDRLFQKRTVGFVYTQRSDSTPEADMHAGAVLKIGKYVYLADPHFSCGKREGHWGWLERVAHKRGLIIVNLGTFTMQGEEPTCMMHAVLLLLLMTQYLPIKGAPCYRDHPVAERYWYCRLVYMLFKREQIADDASDTEQ